TLTCPFCFQNFEIAAPPADELPAELDYDCEVCCRPMMVTVYPDGPDIVAEARSQAD
ncbi:MAG: CPXCG motif-containing cysteine-rich protein, partial [Puniceicoccaceae bacterium]